MLALIIITIGIILRNLKIDCRVTFQALSDIKVKKKLIQIWTTISKCFASEEFTA